MSFAFSKSSSLHRTGGQLAGATLRIIPVLDLKGGEVVRAERGERDRYRPIVTPFSASSDPVAVAEGLRRLHPFSTFYIADLDAIEGRAPNSAALTKLRNMPDAPDLWVDAGLAEEETLAAALAEAGINQVLGSESQRDEVLLRRFRDHPGLILSLDFFADGFRGPQNLLDEPELWPQRVIVMTLAKVGSGAGPDFARLEEIKTKAGNRMLIAAGGVRGEADIRDLSSLGIAAALVATSLHDGTLGSAQLASLGA
jgi:phosphoribosylformimino-5-aminoimidazole carboxamide ribotide isomerase